MIQPLTGYKIHKRNLSVNLNFTFVKNVYYFNFKDNIQ